MSNLQIQERLKGRSSRWTKIHPAIPYVAPFAIFFLLLLSAEHLSFLGQWEYVLRVAILGVALWVFSRDVLDFRVRQFVPTVLVGLAVFAIWIAPDLLIPGYREHWLLQNSITGTLGSSIPGDLRASGLVLFFRTARAIVLVPIIEELFWRAWLLRWLVRPDFQNVPLGTYTAGAMWISAVLFASEHGPYWDVGLVAGLIYNVWIIRTKSLGDCILAHAVTNGALCLYVIMTGRWEYWA
jgi:uncharacterized protein